MSDYEAAITVLASHLTTAGAAVTPAVTRIRRGEPVTAPNTPMLAYYYDGERESTTGGNTFGKVNIEVLVRIGGLFPMSSDDDAVSSALDKWTYSMVRAITSRLYGDASLGGNCIGIEIDTPELVWWQPGGQIRGFELPVWIDLAEIEDIKE